VSDDTTSGPSEPIDVASFATVLLDELGRAIPVWVERMVGQRSAGLVDPGPVVTATVEWVMPRLADLLEADIDTQRTNPLAVLRNATALPTAALADAGIEPVARDAFAIERFPDDIYALHPATWADVDESLTDPGLRWSAAKAFEHRRRHRS
jgi:hypothetical protein